MTIDEANDDAPEPAMTTRVARSLLAQLPLATIGEPIEGETGMLDYRTPLDPDLHLRDFATPALRAMADEIPIQAHLLVLSFGLAVEDRTSTEDAVDAVNRQFAGVAGVVATRLRQALGLENRAADVATVFELHPAFRPRSYVSWDVALDGDTVRLTLGDCPARHEQGFTSWITNLADGHDRALSAIAAGVDPHWRVSASGTDQWSVAWSDEPLDELAEVAVTKFSTGVTHVFIR